MLPQKTIDHLHKYFTEQQTQNSNYNKLLAFESLYLLNDDPDILKEIETVSQFISELHERITNSFYEVIGETESDLIKS
jgi:hypothetical protein